MTRLRKMMLEELQRRNYSGITTRNYLRVVADFAKYFGKSPDKLGPNELRTYQAYLLQDRKLTPGTVVNQVAALRFFFVKTLKRHQFRDFLPYPQDRRRLPTVLSREEVSRLINAAGTLFRRTLLMTLYGTGMRRAELARLKISDIDSQRMIHPRGGRQGRQRSRFASPVQPCWRSCASTGAGASPGPTCSPVAILGADPNNRSRIKPSGSHVTRPRAGLASANASPPTLCVIVGRHICWKLAPTCAPSRFARSWRPGDYRSISASVAATLAGGHQSPGQPLVVQCPEHQPRL